MFKYILIVLVLIGTAIGAFQNCSDNEFKSSSTISKNVDGVGTVPPAVEMEYQLINYPTDICVKEGDRKSLVVEVIDGKYEHAIEWKKVGSEENLSTDNALDLEVNTETAGFYSVTVNDGYKKEERKFNLSICDEPEEPPVEPPGQCTPPSIVATQDATQVTFEGQDRWIGFDVSGDPKPSIKWYFYKTPGDSAKEIFPDAFDHTYDFKPILEQDEGYYYIVADNGCGDAVESPHYYIIVNQRLTGDGSEDSGEAGHVTGWLDELFVNKDGKLQAKGWACSKNYNKSIMIKVIAQKGEEPMQILAKYKTDKVSKVHELCYNKGENLHGFDWTSERPAIDYKGSSVFVKGIHPSGNSGLDRILPPKKLQID